MLESPTCTGIRTGATAEAPVQEPAVTAAHLPLPVELLDGGEVIILALKPSRWFILFDAFKWIVAGLIVVAGASWAGGRLEWISYPALLQATLLVITGRVGVALLRWVSRFYVLTDRRALHLYGVLRTRVVDLALTEITHTRVIKGWHERLVGVGSIGFAAAQVTAHDPTWYHIAKPDEVHAQLRRAIERALDRRG